MRRVSWPVAGPVLAASLAFATGCGPIQSSTTIVEASAALAAAKTAKANEHAPFEYTAAEEYLHKAREEQSYSDFEVAVDYAQKSLACASVARMRAEEAARKELGSTRLGSTTHLRCRPGPKRAFELVDADLEPGAAEAPKPPPGKAVPLKKAPVTSKPSKKTPPASTAPEPEDPPEGDAPNEGESNQ